MSKGEGKIGASQAVIDAVWEMQDVLLAASGGDYSKRCSTSITESFEDNPLAVITPSINLLLDDLAAKRRAQKRATKERDALYQQLAQSQKMEAIGRLAGGVAHDFNNLLTGIIGYAEMLLLDLDASSHQHADVGEIHAAAERAAALTKQLLAFSRKQIVDPKVLDLNEVIKRSNRMLGRIIGEDIELQFFEAKTPWRVHVDPSQIDQILVNLATNARDALPSGGRLTIETKNVVVDPEYAGRHVDVDPGQYLLLAVSDDGQGMDDETQQRAFEPFFSTKEVGRGTGLGLSTVYGIVHQSGGFINIYSEPAVGTTVKIYFPRTAAEGDSDPLPQPTPPAGNELVLIVEDEEIVREITRRILERRGYRVLVATDGLAACELSDAMLSEVDLLLTDVVMPKMNGSQLRTQLAQRRPGLPVLFMSGHSENVIAHHGVLDEGTHFIQKPFAADDLMRKIRKVLDEGA